MAMEEAANSSLHLPPASQTGVLGVYEDSWALAGVLLVGRAGNLLVSFCTLHTFVSSTANSYWQYWSHSYHSVGL